MIGCALFLGGAALRAATNDFAARAERAFAEARLAAQKNPAATTNQLQLARAAFLWAEFPQRDPQREDIAQTGIAAARAIVGREPTNAAAPYWLGMNLGQLARTKKLGALPLVREIEELFHRARQLDPHTDYAGPDRSLGRLYRDAPVWPTSIGSRKKAREHLELAAQLHPEFPDNQLELLESFDAWDEQENFDRQLPVSERAVLQAATRFVGAEWEARHADWSRRLAVAKRQELRAR